MLQAWCYTSRGAGRSDSLLYFYSGQCDSQQTQQVLKAIFSFQQLGQSSSEKHTLQENLSDPAVNYVYVIDSL